MLGANYHFAEDRDYQPMDDDALDAIIGQRRKARQKQEAEELDRILQQSTVTRQRPARQYIPIRHEGWLRRKNKDDQRWANVAKKNEDLANMEALVSENTTRLAVHGHYVAIRGREFMYYQDLSLPEEIRVYGETLSKHLSETVAKATNEAVIMYAELSDNEIAKLYNEAE